MSSSFHEECARALLSAFFSSGYIFIWKYASRYWHDCDRLVIERLSATAHVLMVVLSDVQLAGGCV